MQKTKGRYFPAEEYEARLERVRGRMAEKELDACLISSPENIYYLCGLDHQGYFAYQILIVPREGTPILVTRAMERAIVRDQVPGIRHVGYSDGMAALPPPEDRDRDLVYSTATEHGRAGLEPWSMSYGIPTRQPDTPAARTTAPVRSTCEALEEAGVNTGYLGIEKQSSFLPVSIAEAITRELPDARWTDVSSLVNDLRTVQSPLEIECTRRAARLSDSMMLAAIAAAGPGVNKRDVMAAIYQTMFQRGGTYPGFVPLVRSTRTLEHEHGTWDDSQLATRDVLFLEMAGCIRRYHAPTGRLVFIGRAPTRAAKVLGVCREAIEAAAETIAPGVRAGDVYRAWKTALDRHGFTRYHRHHCGYAVGIGYPPSWSGSGVPVGLRPDSDMELQEGMVFHLMSWLLRTGRGDSFLSDTAIVTSTGCEMLTNTSRELIIR
jgi:Xaa-Pro dipeptidase